MFSSEYSYPGLGDPRLQRQHKFSATDMLNGIFELFILFCFQIANCNIRLHGLCDWNHINSNRAGNYER